MNSKLLEHLQKTQTIPDWVAERLDKLGSEELKERAVNGLKPVIEGALERFCDALEHLEGKVLYDSRAKEDGGEPELRDAGVAGNPVRQRAEAVLQQAPIAAAPGFPTLRPSSPSDVSPAKNHWARAKELLHEHSWLRYGAIAMATWLLPMVGFLFYQCLRLPYTLWHDTLAHRQESASSVTLQTVTDEPTAPPFQITTSAYVDGNKLELHWPALGLAYTYKVFANCHPDDSDHTPSPVSDRAVSTSGARVNVPYSPNCPTPEIQVMAIMPSGAAGPVTDPVTFRLSMLNNAYSLEPISQEVTQHQGVPESGGEPEQRGTVKAGKPEHRRKVVMTSKSNPIAATSGFPPSGITRPSAEPPPQIAAKPSFFSSLAKHLVNYSDSTINSAIPIASVGQGVIAVKNAAVTASEETRNAEGGVLKEVPSSILRTPNSAPVVPAVVNLRGERVGHTVRMTWDSPGTDYRSNVYVAYAGDHPVFDTGNDAPLNGPVITWTPPADGVQVFVLYLKAVDAQGHEGPPSNRIIADLR